MTKPKMIIAGGTGFIGKLLADSFQNDYEVVILSRSKRVDNGSIRYCQWDGVSLGEWRREINGSAVVINLTGKSVDCRHTEKNKQLMWESRIESTKIIAKAIECAEKPPTLWINASGASIYAPSKERLATEDSTDFGTDFLAELSKEWENSLDFSLSDLRASKVRRIALRTTVVLGRDEGALQPILKACKMFLGGKQGSGTQFMSWIHQDDFVRIVRFLIENEQIKGPINMAAPTPVTNAEFMKTLRKVCNRSFGIPTPTPLLKIGTWLIGTEADLVLQSMKVASSVLEKEKFNFLYPTIDKALANIINDDK